MFDRAPDDDDSMLAWFRYFRMTKHLPGMPMKFETEMNRADTPKKAKMVLSAYVAAAFDVIFFCGFRPGTELARELQDTFGLKPSHLMLLSVDEVAQPLKVGTDKLKERLKEGGFTVSDSGIITGFTGPAPQRRVKPSAPGL